MNCVDFESILADYIDGTLPYEEALALEAHVAGCSSCAEFMTEVNGGLSLLESAVPVEPPGELITRIAYLAPRGPARNPFERQSLTSRLTAKWLLPILQPRLAMSMAMTILSFAMLVRCTGVQVQRIRPADLSPVRVWGGVEDKALRVKDQAVKYYENLRIVYEIERHLKDLDDTQDAGARPPSQAAVPTSPNSQPNGHGSAQPSNQGKKQ